MSPNMLTVVLNDPHHPALKADGTQMFPANPKYSQFMYTFNYMPAVTTYLDTPSWPLRPLRDRCSSRWMPSSAKGPL